MKRSFAIGALSDTGNLKKINQDRIFVKIGEDKYGEFGIFMVADGLGGLAAGDEASRIAVKECKKWWDIELSDIFRSDYDIDVKIIGDKLTALIKHINAMIINYSQSINDMSGTTISLLFIYRDKYLVRHVGDSRIYKIRGSRMALLTQDHSWVASQIKQGNMTPVQARNHPRRNVLMQCIGTKADIEIFEAMGYVDKHDIFMICSDGFYNLLDEQEILTALKCGGGEKEIQIAVCELMEKVKSRGAADNASVILVYQNYNRSQEGFFSKLRLILGMN